MTVRVELGDGFQCVLTVKAEHVDLGDAFKQEIREKFVTLCLNHKYHPSTALITVLKEHGEFEVKVHMHLNSKDFHSESVNADVHKAFAEAMHTIANNIAKQK